MTRGRFVVLEGGDGSGKSTQAARLAAWLRDRGLTVCETFEPGAGAIGAVIRELLLHGTEPVTPVTEALLMAADRAQHVATEIEPALARGDWVVCDRYVPSSLVYQGVVRGLGVEHVAALSDVATAGPHARCRARVRRGRRRSRPRASGFRARPARTRRRRLPHRGARAPTATWHRSTAGSVVDGDGDRRRGCRARP